MPTGSNPIGQIMNDFVPLQRLPRNVAALLTFSRPVLVFFAFGCALWLMATHFPPAYMLGLSFLILATGFDWIDGWFAERYLPESRLGALVDRMMDRMVLSIIFPVLGAGMFWRYTRTKTENFPQESEQALLHAIFVLGLCIMVLLRDQFSQFLRSFAKAAGQEIETHELTRLRTMVASPMATLLYAYAFFQPTQGWETFYRWVNWIDDIPLRGLFVAEIVFLVITIASVSLHLRKYGALALEDICEDDERLRRRILSVIPNTLTMMNGVLGITAVVFASHGRMREALFVLVGAAFFDRLDGLMARRLGLTTPSDGRSGKSPSLGAILDDLSDGISFALAPALMFFLVLSDMREGTLHPLVLAATAVVYGAAGISRLIYFTLDKEPIPGFFKGMPVPAAALMVTACIEIVFQVQNHIPEYLDPAMRLSVAMLVLAALMMNLFPVRYLHVGRLMSRRPWLFWLSLGSWLGLVFTPFFGAIVLIFSLFYLGSPLFTRRIQPEQADLEHRLPRANFTR